MYRRSIMTNHKDAPEIEKPAMEPSSGQAAVKGKDLDMGSTSDQDPRDEKTSTRSSESEVNEDGQTTSDDLSREGKSTSAQDEEEEDVLVDTLANLDITKKSGSGSLSESSLESDGDASGCDSDLDSDGLTGNEGLVERGIQRNRRHDKPYDRPSPATPKNSACLQETRNDGVSGAGLITPEDDDLLRNLDFIDDMSDLSSAPGTRSPVFSGSSNQSQICSSSPLQVDDTQDFVELLRSIDQQPYQNNGATQTPFCPPIHSEAMNIYPSAPQLHDNTSRSLTYPGQLGPLPADETTYLADNVPIPTVVAEKMNETEPPKKQRRRRKKVSQSQPSPAATSVSNQPENDLSPPQCVGNQIPPALCPPIMTSANVEQELKEAMEFIRQEELNRNNVSPLHNHAPYAVQPVSSCTGVSNVLHQSQLSQGGNIPPQQTNHHTGQPSLFNIQTVPGSQMQTSQANGCVNSSLRFPCTLSQTNGVPGNPLLQQQAYRNSTLFHTPTFSDRFVLRPLKPNSAQYKFICAGSIGAASQPYFAFPFQPVQQVQPIQPNPVQSVLLVASPQRQSTDHFTLIRPKPI